MTLNIYQNDYGAINEGFSDIFGNLVEGLLGKTDDKTWLLQENSDDIIRSMSDPNKYEQPAYVWDRYYVPEANEATENNDEDELEIMTEDGIPEEWLLLQKDAVTDPGADRLKTLLQQ